jgi:drug/metabolite transporter (DMT)-like permease
MRPKFLIALLLMNVFWAASYSAFKSLAADYSVGQIVTWRFLLVAVPLLLAWPWLPGQAPSRRDVPRIFIMGVIVFVLSPRLQVLGVHLGKAGDSSVVVGLEPLVTAVVAAVWLREHVPARRWAGFLLGLAGLVVLNGGWRLELAAMPLLANLIFVSSFLCESGYSVLAKPLLGTIHPLRLIASSVFAGTAVNLILDGPAALAAIPRLTVGDWANLGYLALVCSLIGYALWLYVIRETDVNLAALTILAQPVFGVLAAAVLLSEPMHWGQAWGTMVILVGLCLGFTTGRSPLDPRAPDAPSAPSSDPGFAR